MKTLFFASILAGCTIIPASAQDASSPNFLTGLSDFQHIRDTLPGYLNRLALAQLARRDRAAAGLNSTEAVAARRAYVREHILRAIGGLPQRTPLGARVVGVLERDGYHVEKIVFESQPRFYVTANLYVPARGNPPYPAVLYPLGHESGGKAYPVWQQMLITLARRGYVALTWDTLGQGERSQFYDPDLEDSKLGHLRYTTEHTMLGVQCLLTGDNLARYTIWDGMRALDYLLSRPEVDPRRVACTGNSGGGTHTAYLAALDDRIAVAAPSCYLTSWKRLIPTIGPQDAEQCMPPILADGLDHADFVHAFAPKPYLILSAIRDFFPISGARQTFAEAQRVYAALDASGKVAMFEADDGHGYNPERRQAAYRWLGKWLKGAEDNEPEGEAQVEPAQALNCTGSGQVDRSLGGETVFSLNRERIPARQPLPAADLRAKVRELIAYEPAPGSVHVQRYGEMRRASCRIEKLLFESEPGIPIPSLLFIPQGIQAPAPAVVYVHGRGKAADAAPGGAIEQLAAAGFAVLAIDVRGIGETAVSEPQDGQRYSNYFGDYASTMKALLIGKTLVGMRAADISRAVDLLAARPEIDRARIYGLGKEAGALPLLHAAVLDQRIARVLLDGMLVSYKAVVTSRLHRDVFESVVPGALQYYDLPDLLALLSENRAWSLNAADPLGQPAGGQPVPLTAAAASAFLLAGSRSR